MTDLLDTGEAPLIVLVDAASDVERRLIEQKLPSSLARDGVTVLPIDDQGLARSLAAAQPAAVVSAVRVVWSAPPPALPRRPPALLQRFALRRDPGRAQVVVAEAAPLAELSQRWGGHGTLAEFVSGQAALALDRAERAVVGARAKFPRQVAEAIEKGSEFRAEVAELAADLDRPEREVRAEAVTDLRGLVASMSPLAIEVFAGTFRPLHAHAWDVEVDSAGLERLREANRRHSLVFLPSHRSYVDPLILADVLAAHDFPRNHVLGGENLRFWPVGPVAKRAGTIFIRRRFGSDRVYKLAVREYFAFLLSKRFNLEWYMEGGRSRTGKLRPPRHGLLSYVAEAVQRGRVDDVHLVPVAITYDQLREVSGMAAEQGGAAKKPEGLSWLASYARAQRTRLGTVHVAFAEPISLAHSLPSGDDPDAHRLALQKVAFEVAVRINGVTPATAPALVTLALLGVRDRALTGDQVRRVAEPLLDYLDQRGLPQSGERLRTDRGLRRTLAALVAQKVVTAYEGGEEPVYAIESGKHLVAAFYRNSAIHHFVERAIAELVLLREPGARWEEALRLRDQLKFEFFFPDRDTYRARLAAELTRLHPDWETVDGVSALKQAPVLLAQRVLRSFVDAQLVVAERLAARNPREALNDNDFLQECESVGRQMLLQGRLHGPESLSRELFSSALQLAGNLDLADPGREELGLRRQDWAAQVRDVVQRVTRIDELDALIRRQSVGVEP